MGPIKIRKTLGTLCGITWDKTERVVAKAKRAATTGRSYKEIETKRVSVLILMTRKTRRATITRRLRSTSLRDIILATAVERTAPLSTVKTKQLLMTAMSSQKPTSKLCMGRKQQRLLRPNGRRSPAGNESTIQLTLVQYIRKRATYIHTLTSC